MSVRIHGKLQTGIGRPVAEAWFQQFQDLVDHEAPGSTWFIPRSSPGIQYVSAEELGKLQREDYRGEETERRVASQARWLIETLGRGGDLNPEPSAAISLDRSYGITLERRNNATKVRTRVLDIPSELYPEGYLCAGERAVVRKALGLDSPPHTREVPVYNVQLGLIEGELSEINFFLSGRVTEGLPPAVDFQGVDITRL